MLNRAKVLEQIQQLENQVWNEDVSKHEKVFAVWRRIAVDKDFAAHVAMGQAPWPLPSWEGLLATSYRSDQLNAYTAISVDGSQIYPDRHQGTNCFLINIGSVSISYSNGPGKVFLNSEPLIFWQDPRQGSVTLHEAIDSLRQEHELVAGVKLSHGLFGNDKQTCLLFDGTLIFWHVDTDPAHKNYFLPRYCAALDACAHNGVPVGGYISAPRSKELVNLVRFALHQEGVTYDEANNLVMYVTDAMLVNSFLPVNARTQLFQSNSAICLEYPSHVRPWFFYLNVGSEIARVEIPAWVAHASFQVDMMVGVLIDQVVKGRGYPVVLAEAHEQAVVKGSDRDFFYHMLRKESIDRSYFMMPSQKV